MKRIVTLILALSLVSACNGGGSGSNPLQEPEEEPDTGTDTGTPIESDRTLPPGTATPTPNRGIFRTEVFTEDGNGFAHSITRNSATDTFFVDGLAFDGSQPDGVAFSRSSPGSLGAQGTFALYEAPVTHPDFLTATPIGQFQHRALYGVSATGNTEFAIVRTGNYIPYGFGGFVYQRNNGVTIPTQGQATYSGDYGAIRDFDGDGGLQYASGSMRVDIDFNGFSGNCTGISCADAVRGYVIDRRIYSSDGTDLTQTYIDALETEYSTTLTELPIIRFKVGPGVSDVNGELVGEAFSSVAGETLDSGNYYAVMSGNHTSGTGGEIVGVIIVEGDDPTKDSVTVRETGGFIVTR
ncbi:hypothetical protein [Puniceibacterium confluentis]|uniref:hypothetical protein n=1 Tax=Puniceibacterium confluentis TaxID=1958944 RepID=UPI0011B8454D|nr:hypothetical protein [Puniceibacterium confluentis]